MRLPPACLPPRCLFSISCFSLQNTLSEVQGRERVTAGTNHGVDPALWPLVEGFPPIDLGPDTLTGFREAMVALSVLPEASSHRDVRLEEVTLVGGGAAA